jgi:hypothetical protein
MSNHGDAFCFQPFSTRSVQFLLLDDFACPVCMLNGVLIARPLHSVQL